MNPLPKCTLEHDPKLGNTAKCTPPYSKGPRDFIVPLYKTFSINAL